ncbi:MAG: polysaccharide deacetylase family protein [Blautia sp.]|nr:polysaccharide deacetylase family protein [Blautia sp.]
MDFKMGKNWIKKIRTIAAALTWSLFLTAVGVGAGAFNREKRQIIQVIQIEKPKVALTFDDGPNKKYTPALLNELGKRGIHASFFLMGKNIPGNEKLVQQMQKEGHLLGNHTYNHVELDKIPVAQARTEVERTSNEIYKITGVYPQYVRPPFGAWPKNFDLLVTMFPVLWDVDTLDWKSKNVDCIMRLVRSQVKDGSIILMHDGYQTSVDAAVQIMDELLERGYEFVTVDQLLIM